MRWNGLFDDLEAHWADLGWQETVAEAAELTRAEWMALSLVDRLRGARGRQVRLHLAWGEVVDGVVHTVGQGWVGVHVDGSGSAIVAVDCVAAVEADLTRAAVAPELAAAGWGTVLRGIARTRQPVAVTGRLGAALAEGTVDRVGGTRPGGPRPSAGGSSSRSGRWGRSGPRCAPPEQTVWAQRACASASVHSRTRARVTSF